LTESQPLERRYRRFVALYPRAFRRDSEEEIVSVLLATARPGQRRVGMAESADLIRGAVQMHRGPRLPRALLTAVRLTYVGAAAQQGPAALSAAPPARPSPALDTRTTARQPTGPGGLAPPSSHERAMPQGVI
jgi:hypothetical protein